MKYGCSFFLAGNGSGRFVVTGSYSLDQGGDQPFSTFSFCVLFRELERFARFASFVWRIYAPPSPQEMLPVILGFFANISYIYTGCILSRDSFSFSGIGSIKANLDRWDNDLAMSWEYNPNINFISVFFFCFVVFFFMRIRDIMVGTNIIAIAKKIDSHKLACLWWNDWICTMEVLN